jgi:hypothetical protein
MREPRPPRPTVIGEEIIHPFFRNMMNRKRIAAIDKMGRSNHESLTCEEIFIVFRAAAGLDNIGIDRHRIQRVKTNQNLIGE